jgi:hypothetical protein
MLLMSAKLTRRSVIGLVLSSTSAALIAACTATSPVPSVTPASAVKPTVASAPTAGQPVQAEAAPKSGG